MLKELGVESVVYIDFTEEVKIRHPKNLIRKFILDKFDLKKSRLVLITGSEKTEPEAVNCLWKWAKRIILMWR